MAITTLDAVKMQAGIADQSFDLWLAGVIAAVGDAMESATGRYLWPRPATTALFDGSDSPWTLRVPRGVSAITYLGVAWVDQPDDGSGSYTTVPMGWVYLDPPAWQRRPGQPAYAVSVSPRGGIALPIGGRRLVKLTGDLGPTAVAPRAGQIAVNACVRAWRAKTSGGADYAIIGPDGGMRIMRDLAPAELEELYGAFGTAGGYA